MVNSRPGRGSPGLQFDYDRLQDLAENHRKWRSMMGIGDWNASTSFSYDRIRDNVCLLMPETISRIYQRIVTEGHRLNPDAEKAARVDSFVIETNIHYPTQIGLI